MKRKYERGKGNKNVSEKLERKRNGNGELKLSFTVSQAFVFIRFFKSKQEKLTSSLLHTYLSFSVF